MGEKRNIYGRKLDLIAQYTERTLTVWENTEQNKALIRSFQIYLKAKGNSDLRINKVTIQLRNICDVLNKELNISKNLDELEKDDIVLLIAIFNKKTDIADATKTDYRRVIKHFFKIFKKKDLRLKSRKSSIVNSISEMYDYLNEEVHTAEKLKQIDPSNVITDEDLNKLLVSSDNTLYKAVISVLFETGTRVGELLGMRIKDIQFQERIGRIHIDGKTGRRPINILHSIPYLTRWLEDHPDKNNPDAYVWVSKFNKHYGKPLNYAGIRKILIRTFERAGINKPRNLHWFRHSKASHLHEEGYNDASKKRIMGWASQSKQPARYVHVSDNQIEDEFKRKNGLEETKIQKPSLLYCGCGQTNSPEGRYCVKCGRPLSLNIEFEDQEKIKVQREKLFENLMEIMQNPELLKRFEEFKKNRQ